LNSATSLASKFAARKPEMEHRLTPGRGPVPGRSSQARGNDSEIPGTNWFSKLLQLEFIQLGLAAFPIKSRIE
jgi:hypothetical protein